MEVIVDRFEGELAVVELPDGALADMPAKLVPGAREGDVIRITIDKEATRERAAQINKLVKNVWAD